MCDQDKPEINSGQNINRKTGQIWDAKYGWIDPHEKTVRNLADALATSDRLIESQKGLIAVLDKKVEEHKKINDKMIRLGLEQSEEWDRFWEALDVCREDITVDDAILKWQRMKSTNFTERKLLMDLFKTENIVGSAALKNIYDYCRRVAKK